MRARGILAAAALALLVLAIFGQTAQHEFLNYDDDVYITENPFVSRGLTGGGLRRAFGFHAGNWHPLTWASHMLDVELFGLDPGPHHLVNTAIHGVSAVLLMLLLARFTGAPGRSALVAALFAVHPQHVESVAWAAERKDVLAGLFWVLTLAAWLRYVRRPGWRSYSLAVAVFGVGLTAKQTLVSLPLILLVLDWWPFGRLASSGRIPVPRLLFEKGPLFLLGAAAGVATFKAQHTDIPPLVTPELPLRLANAVVSAAAYLADTVWPSGLALFYPYPVGGVPAWTIVLSLVVLVILAVGAAAARRRQPWLLAGAVWYILALLPVIGIIQVGGQARADRYVYLPHIGVFLAAVWFARALVRRRPRVAAASAVSGVALVVLLAFGAHRQTALWKDNHSIMRHTASVTQGNYIALNNLGNVYLDELGRPDKAVPVFLEALRANPRHANAWYNLGLAQFALGRLPEAAASFSRALRLTPHDLDTHYNLGLTCLLLGQNERAERHFGYIVAVDPAYRDARIQLVVARGRKGRRQPTSP